MHGCDKIFIRPFQGRAMSGASFPGALPRLLYLSASGIVRISPLPVSGKKCGTCSARGEGPPPVDPDNASVPGVNAAGDLPGQRESGGIKPPLRDRD
jgi:hypothetical protein